MSRPRILLLLFVLLGLALTYAWLETPRLQRTTASHEVSTGVPGVIAGKNIQTGQSEFDLDFSSNQQPSYKKPKRDLFRPLYEKPKPVKTVVFVPPPPEPVAVMLPPPTVIMPVVVPKVGPKPIPPLKVLGYLQKGATQIAFLASPQGEVYVVKQGDRFADGLLVRELNADRILISRDLTDQGVTLYFSKENARLKTATLVSDRPSFVPVEIPQTETINSQLQLPIEQPSNVPGEKTVDP